MVGLIVLALATRLPLVASIRAAMERERALRGLSGERQPLLTEDEGLRRVLLDRLRVPDSRSLHPWRVGVTMVGSPHAPWNGTGLVVRNAPDGRSCTVWSATRPYYDQPNRLKWSSRYCDSGTIAVAIFDGQIQDGYT